MKKLLVNAFVGVLTLLMFQSSTLFSQEIKYKKMLNAKGTINWRLEDTEGNIVKEGTVVDGEWRQSGGMLIDYLVLDKDESNTIKTALVLLGTKRCPMGEMAVQVFHEGSFYPGKKYSQRYEFEPNDWDDSGTRYGMGNKNIMLFNFGAVSCYYRSMVGCMLNHIILPTPESSFKIALDDKYIFYILGETDYKWEK